MGVVRVQWDCATHFCLHFWNFMVFCVRWHKFHFHLCFFDTGNIVNLGIGFRALYPYSWGCSVLFWWCFWVSLTGFLDNVASGSDFCCWWEALWMSLVHCGSLVGLGYSMQLGVFSRATLKWKSGGAAYSGQNLRGISGIKLGGLLWLAHLSCS